MSKLVESKIEVKPSLSDSYSKNQQLVRELLAELFGTYMLLLIGGTGTASYVLNIGFSPTKTLDFLAVNYIWGFAVFVGAMVSIQISGGHINPALTIALATRKLFPWAKVVPYMIVQLIGAFLGAVTTYLVYYDAISIQHDKLDSVKLTTNDTLLKNNPNVRAFGHPLSTGGIFATYPARHATIYGVFFDQVVATASLLISVRAVTDKNNLDVPLLLVPFLLAFVIATHAQAWGFNTSCSMNPARDFGPRLFTWMAGWGLAVFRPLDGYYWIIGGILGPIVGAILGVWIYYFLVEFPKTKLKVNVNDTKEVKPIPEIVS